MVKSPKRLEVCGWRGQASPGMGKPSEHPFPQLLYQAHAIHREKKLNSSEFQTQTSSPQGLWQRQRERHRPGAVVSGDFLLAEFQMWLFSTGDVFVLNIAVETL